MSPLEESLSLKQFPIPSDAMIYSACAKDLVLPFIVQIQEKIVDATAQLAYLHKQLEILKSRAISENIKDSGYYYLVEIPGKQMRNPISDIIAFARRFPLEYDAIRESQKDKLCKEWEEKMVRVDVAPIPLLLADAKVGYDTVTEFVGFQPQKVEVEVRMKRERRLV